MKIIRLVSSLDYGGVERRLINISHWQDEHEWIFCALGKGGEAEKQIMENGKNVVVLAQNIKIPSLVTILSLINFFRKEMPDVIHTSGAEANFHGVIAGRLAGIKNIITEEIGIPGQSKVANKVFQGIYRFSNHVLCNAKVVADYLVLKNKVSMSKVKIIDNPIPKSIQSKIAFSNDGIFRVLTVSRLEPVKNLESLILVFSKILQYYPKTILTIIGDGPQKEHLKGMVNEMNLDHKVDFVGFKTRPWEAILNVDLFVLNSHTEGFSNALAEAMLLGIPVLSTKAGVAPKLIYSGKSGWLVSPGNENELLSTMLSIMGLSLEELCEIGLNGKREVEEKYSLEKHVSDLMDIYNN
ncbi:glycosyltransferase [Echinicola marina]|uniref:glycosyltransferase n=1 Tax=Echinicola marina TaxID=2859768 RepID=UPI001CF64C60|nr:glycosyltransferase [Echinicola marina]UCS91999.1 glycosyltransferase [Echinicola marina]